MDDEASQANPGTTPSLPTGGTFVSASATVAIWRVLNAMRDGWFLEKRLRDVARMLAADARARGLRAEQMLVALKRDWPKLLEHRRVPGEAELSMLCERLVTFCIVEYYAVT